MKFAKLLGNHPGECFVRYKQLKKQLKQIAPHDVVCFREGEEDAAISPPSTARPSSPPSITHESEQAFIAMLQEDVNKFNEFFMEKEEECVMRHQALKDRLVARFPPALVPSSSAHASLVAEQQRAARDLADLHGEMVLMLHWSMLNYAAVCKILKKHDKRTGLLLRAPLLENMLRQPFFSTHILERLIQEAELLLRLHLSRLGETSGAPPHPPHSGAAPSSLPLPMEVTLPPARVSSGNMTDGSSPGVESGGSDGGKMSVVGGALVSATVRRNSEPGGKMGLEGEGGMVGSAPTVQRVQAALDLWHVMSSTAATPSTVLPVGGGGGGGGGMGVPPPPPAARTGVSGVNTATLPS